MDHSVPILKVKCRSETAFKSSWMSNMPSIAAVSLYSTLQNTLSFQRLAVAARTLQLLLKGVTA